MNSNLLTLTAFEIQQHLEAGKISSAQLVESYFRQIDRHENYLHALISQPPRESTLHLAKRLDAERAVGKSRGRLHGIPVLVKDNMATDPDLQMDTAAGTLALAGSRPKRNAAVVDKLRRAGAIILGKTNMSELGFFKGSRLDCGWSAVGGQTQSAYVRGGFRIDDSFAGHSNPAGSSSGSAVGVSAGYAPVSLGTETEGSLIVPASRAALYTIKPTIPLIPRDGIIPVTSLFDSAGPMAKSVLDLAILMDVLVDQERTSVPTGGYVSAVTGEWDSLRMGALDPEIWTFPTSARKSEPAAEKQMIDETWEAYSRLRSLADYFKPNVSLLSDDEFEYRGRHVLSALCGECHQQLPVFRTNLSAWMIKTDVAQNFKAEFAAYLKDVEACKISGLKDLIVFNREHAEEELPPRECNPRQDLLEAAEASDLAPEEVNEIVAHMRDVARTRGIDALFEKEDVNIVIGPAESSLAQYAAGAGYPIASLPLGYLGFNGRPHGLAAVAKAHGEATLIQLQSAWEASFPLRQPPVL